MASPFEHLLAGLALERLDRDLFLGEPGPGSGRLFGGMVAAQSYRAAAHTVEQGALHSLHAYFLRPGRHDVPIRFAIDRIRDGRTFTTRRVVAHQAGEAIFNLSCSFASPEEGISHQLEMPAAPPPEAGVDWDAGRGYASPIEVRGLDPNEPEQAQEPRCRFWLRPRGPVPDDPILHTALLVYASDRALLSTAARPHPAPREARRAASLDHAFWLHRPPRFDDWLLYAMESPVAHAARGLVFGALYQADGTRVASTAQEALIRFPRGL